MQVPGKQHRRRRVSGGSENSCVRRRVEHKDHVWSYDFLTDRPEDGGQQRAGPLEIGIEDLLKSVMTNTPFAARGPPVIQVQPSRAEEAGQASCCELTTMKRQEMVQTLACPAENPNSLPRVKCTDCLVDAF